MPGYFISCTTNGILLSSHKFDKKLLRAGSEFPKEIYVKQNKTVTLKNGRTFNLAPKAEKLKIGFIACPDPKDLGYEFGEEMPLTITEKLMLPNEDGQYYFPKEWNVCWASPD
jgi:hypothetical protein